MNYPEVAQLDESYTLNSNTETGNCSKSFRSYVSNDPFNRISITLAICALIIQYCVFKYFYPNMGFINGDSYAYISSAFYNLRADIYPIGYPKFLRLISVFSYTDVFLASVQFFFIELSLLGLVYTVFYFYDPKRFFKILLILFTVFNPIYLFLSNYVCSDALFFALSVFWFTLLVWILNRPTLTLIIIHGLVIALLFSIRYNALFYPAISFFTFVIVKKLYAIKTMGIVFGMSLICLFVLFTSNQFKRISGVKQFSPFSGWQLANNAMYAYRFVDSSERRELPIKFRALDLDVRHYFDTTRDHNINPQEMLYASTVYMWDPISPLKIYEEKFQSYDSTVGELTKWSKVAPLYSEYGSVLIRTYPNEFLKYYLWPNFLKFYVPPVEFLGSYSTGVDSVPVVAKQWFWYKTNKLKTRVGSYNVSLFKYYPILSASINAVFVASCVLFFVLFGFRNRLFSLVLCASFFWFANFGFSIFASPVALRFQLFPIYTSLLIILLILNEFISFKENLNVKV